jgi:hypothetical protein
MPRRYGGGWGREDKADEFIKESLIIDVRAEKAGTATYEAGTFDIVLAPAK